MTDVVLLTTEDFKLTLMTKSNTSMFLIFLFSHLLPIDFLSCLYTSISYCVILVGFLVTWSHSQLTDDLYHREHLFHFSSQGQLLGALPFLGASPFSFCAVYLSSDRDIQDRYPGYGSSGWHVYMRDGHGGIIGLKLSDY
jgi:glucose-6-phosphate-specific signal transduction histidine kinase